jgi:CYTH domain-containing protein
MAEEIERKFLLKNDTWKAAASGTRFRQGYLSTVKERTVRVRLEGDRGFLTVKGISTGAVRKEYEYEIPVQEAGELLGLCEQPLIEKTRCRIEHKGLTWEVDEFEGKNRGLVLAEIELDSEDQEIELPCWIGREVTDDPRYFNANLVKNPFNTWNNEQSGSRLIFKAIVFAAEAHYGQYRKGSLIPYLIHPLEVGNILIEHGCIPDVVAAGILHDTVEDTSACLESINSCFGGHVAELVQGVSEPDKSDTWENRKSHTIDYLKCAPLEILYIACADKLHNARSILKDYKELGDAVWTRFSRAREDQEWYYTSLAEIFTGRGESVSFNKLAADFKSVVDEIFTE